MRKKRAYKGKKTGKMIEQEGYYCDCIDPSETNKRKFRGLYPIRLVKVVGDEQCADCGFYAIYKLKGEYIRGSKTWGVQDNLPF